MIASLTSMPWTALAILFVVTLWMEPRPEVTALRAMIAVGALSAGALVGISVSPEMGMLAAGGGLIFTRGASKLRKKNVKHVVIRPVEQQVLEQGKVAVPGHKSAVTSLQCAADGSRLAVVMLQFADGKADVLVCSTIIESGLDIPNVNTIVVNNADMFGLAQLYQLRGRVGRGANRAYAVAISTMAPRPLSARTWDMCRSWKWRARELSRSLR